jgi:hypothetical protein
MKNQPDSDSARAWAERLRRARADVPPPVDRAALLRSVRSAMLPAPEPPGWTAELARLFSPAKIVPACLGAAAAIALFASVQAWDTWQALPWAQLLGTINGGGQ